ncbi:MAG: multiheme c-type cytochrome [Planctomycetota bacterium]|nr:multiheme c-type cytochrome [Planctomycetota bacterium]
MAFRNWKQELDDRRPPPPSRWPFIRNTAAALVLLAGGACTALWVWPGYLKPRPWVRPGPAPAALRILLSSDLSGYIEPCGCTEQRWGGIARQASAVRRGKAPASIALDVGDMTAGARRWQQVGLETYLQALGAMEYTAANLGSREIGLSAAALRDLAARSPVPLVSANVREEAGGALLVAPYRQVMTGNLRVTVVGVVAPDPQRPLGEGVRVQDVDEALSKLLPTLRAETDVIVLLAAADEPTIRKVAASHPEADVVLGGRVAQASKSVLTVGSSRVVALADKGQMIAQVDVAISPDGRPGAAQSRMILLDNAVPEDPAMLDLAGRYNAELSRLNRTGGLKALGVPTLAPPAGENAYVGAEACRACHPKEFQSWSTSKHARAYASLVRRQRDSNPDCVSCHVVDLGAGDGFLGLPASPDRLDVQCEACHGRGAAHVRSRAAGQTVVNMPRVLPGSCQVCHDCTHSPKFTYETYWEAIKHGPDKKKTPPASGPGVDGGDPGGVGARPGGG